MTVRVDTPQLQVTLRKLVRNQSGKAARYSSGPSSFDLSAWLTEDSSVSVTRQINAPSGSFSITVSDRVVVHGETMDSLYGIVEPMDVVEIRMARRATQKLPLVFRGIVSKISRDEAMGQDGKPRRFLTIAGQDWGKFFQIIQNRWYKGASLAKDWMSAWHMQTLYGIEYQVMTAGQTVQVLLEKIGNPFIARLQLDKAAMPKFTWDVSGADDIDKVFPQGFQPNPGGTLWNFLSMYGDLGPFYELFIDDEEAAPRVIYRKPPFIAADGKPVHKTQAAEVPILAKNITRLSVTRSDEDVANYWWVDHKRLMFQTGHEAQWMQLGSAANPFLPNDHPSASPEIYGNRPMEVSSNHGFMTPGAPEPVVQQETTEYIAYTNAKRLRLQAANKDNVLFESGQMVLAGNEEVKVGRMLSVNRGGLVSRYYAQGVTHNFQPFRAFTTSVSFIRGTGFIARSSKEIGAKHPYLSEIGRGPYEGDLA